MAYSCVYSRSSSTLSVPPTGRRLRGLPEHTAAQYRGCAVGLKRKARGLRQARIQPRGQRKTKKKRSNKQQLSITTFTRRR
eukprot:388395-Pyramimonas_sp.AAC.1